MGRTILTLFQLLIAVGLSHRLAAQRSPIGPGSRIRLTAPTVSAAPIVGKVESSRADTILLRTSATAVSAVPFDRVTQLELSRGARRPTWSLTAPLWMPLAGGGLAAIGGAAKPASRSSRGDSAVFAAYGGGLLGFVVGLVTAVAVGEREHWDTVPTPRDSRAALAPSLYVAPAGHGLTLGFRASF